MSENCNVDQCNHIEISLGNTYHYQVSYIEFEHFYSEPLVLLVKTQIYKKQMEEK